MWKIRFEHTKEKSTRKGCFSRCSELLSNLLGGGSSTVLRDQLFLDSRRLARTLAQVVQLRATDVTATLHDDAREQRRVGLERTLDAFARRNLADDEVRVQATIALCDHHAFVSLHALARTFDDVHVDDDRVARSEVGDGLLAQHACDLFLLELFNQIHY